MLRALIGCHLQDLCEHERRNAFGRTMLNNSHFEHTPCGERCAGSFLTASEP